MAVTRLKRKEAKNRSRAQVRTANLKRLNHKHNIPSPYKGESGIVLEDQEEEVKTDKVETKAEREEIVEAKAEETSTEETATEEAQTEEE